MAFTEVLYMHLKDTLLWAWGSNFLPWFLTDSTEQEAACERALTKRAQQLST